MTDKELQITLSSYEKAIDFYLYEGNGIWTRINAVLIFHSVFIVAILQLFSGGQKFYNLAETLSILGIFFCLIWLFLMERSLSYQDYWFRTLMETEKRLRISPTLKKRFIMIERIEDFSKNHKVTFDLSLPNDKKHQTNLFSLVKLRLLIRSLNLMCVIVYIVILLTFLHILPI